MSRMFPQYFALSTLMPGEDTTDELGRPLPALIRKGRCYVQATSQEVISTSERKTYARFKFYIDPRFQAMFTPGMEGVLLQIDVNQFNNQQFQPDIQSGEGRIVEVRIDKAISSRRTTVRVMTA